MKIKSIAFFVLSIIGHLSFSQSGEKVLVSSINPQNRKIIKIELVQPVEAEHWKGDVVKILTTVSIDHVSEAVLKSLVTAGRYRIESTIENDSVIISAPALQKQISLGGNPIVESISYHIYVPEGMMIEIESEIPSKLFPVENMP